MSFAPVGPTLVSSCGATIRWSSLEAKRSGPASLEPATGAILAMASVLDAFHAPWLQLEKRRSV